jgi:hypothetical protein
MESNALVPRGESKTSLVTLYPVERRGPLPLGLRRSLVFVELGGGHASSPRREGVRRYVRLKQFLAVDLHIHPDVARRLNVSSLTVPFHGSTDGSEGLGRARGWGELPPVEMAPHGEFRRAYIAP